MEVKKQGGSKMPKIRDMGEWTDEKYLKLFSLVEANPCLWNKRDAFHSRKEVTDAALKLIAETLECSAVEAQARWRSMRQTFFKYLQKEKQIKSGNASGGIGAKRREWRFMSSLRFLACEATEAGSTNNLYTESMTIPLAERQEPVSATQDPKCFFVIKEEFDISSEAEYMDEENDIDTDRSNQTQRMQERKENHGTEGNVPDNFSEASIKCEDEFSETSQLYNCVVCAKNFSTESDLEVHRHSHTSAHKCSGCGNQLKRLKERFFMCETCSKIFIFNSPVENVVKSTNAASTINELQTNTANDNNNIAKMLGEIKNLMTTMDERQKNFEAKLDHLTSEVISIKKIVQNRSEEEQYEISRSPFSSEEEFFKFNESLKDEENLTKFTHELQSNPEKSYEKFIRSSLRKIVSDDLSRNFSWRGTSTKKRLREMRVTLALRNVCKRKFPINDAEFDRIVKKYFQHAHDRIVKREHKKKFKLSAENEMESILP